MTRTRPIRVLHLTRDYPPHVRGGLSLLVGNAVEALRPDAEPQILSFDDWRPKRRGADFGAHPAAAAPAPVAWRWPGLLRIRNGAPPPSPPVAPNGDAPDLIHLHDALLWPNAQHLAQHFACPLLFTVHTLQAEQNALRGVTTTHSGAEERQAMEGADRIHALSATCADTIVDHYPFAARRVRLVPAGVPLPNVRQPPPGVNDTTVLYAGRFSDLKDLDTLVRAFGRVASTHMAATLVLAGGVPERPSAAQRWERRLRALLPSDVAPSRIVVRPWADPETTRARIACATVVACPSRFETFGQLPLEALVHGVPLIATRTGRMGDIAPALDASRARLVDPGNVEQVTSALAAFLAAGRRPLPPLPDTLSRELSWHHLRHQWLALYRDTLAAGHSAADDPP